MGDPSWCTAPGQYIDPGGPQSDHDEDWPGDAEPRGVLGGCSAPGSGGRAPHRGHQDTVCRGCGTESDYFATCGQCHRQVCPHCSERCEQCKDLACTDCKDHLAERCHLCETKTCAFPGCTGNTARAEVHCAGCDRPDHQDPAADLCHGCLEVVRK